MKRVTISIPDETDLKFRKLASQRYRFEKGWYSKAIIEAIKIWINKNEAYFLNEGLSKVSRDIGQEILNKTKILGELDSKNPFIVLDTIVDYVNTNYAHINELNYKISDDNMVMSLKNHETDVIEDYIERFLCPLIMVSRVGIEEITGNQYEISSLGNVSKITLSRKLGSDEMKKQVHTVLRSTTP